MEQERYEEAAQLFRRVIALDRAADLARGSRALRALSYYGFCLARAGHSEIHSLEACRSAVASRPRDPILHLNLGRVHAELGRIGPAMAAFTDGLRLQPDHPAILREWEALERRRQRPAVPFLSRSNPLNRWLGRSRRQPSASPDDRD